MQSKNFATILAFAAVLAGVCSNASARPRPAGRANDFEANKTFGLGLMIGAPTGLSGKYYIASDRAIDFGVGGIRYYRARDGLHLHIDHLWHPASLVKARAFELPLYVGLGARAFLFDDGAGDRAMALGARVPFGIAFDFNRVPLDIFFEFAIVVDFLLSYHDDFGIDGNGSIGIRYYFD